MEPGILSVRDQPRPLVLTAAIIFLSWLVYYGLCLFPGLGGELNTGDSAKFQILGHTSIMVHGPGYPLVLLLGAGVRALALPFTAWWTLTFALSAAPAAFANSVSFLIVHRLTGSYVYGIAAALLLGSAGLMAIQATEAEVYALALAFILTILFLLILFVETKNIRYFVAACAVYALSFGNHLMMIMFISVFIYISIAHYRIVLRPVPVCLVLFFILLGASQYLYLAYVANDPATAYSEYMPLPPQPMELVHYILGTYFSDLYGSGMQSTTTLEALIGTLRSAHPWISLPMIVVGILLFIAGWKYRDTSWRCLAVVYGGALAFLPFVLWYGAYDIQAFHLPMLGPLLVATVAVPGWWLRGHPALRMWVGAFLILIGTVRAGQTALVLGQREPIFTGLRPAVEQMVAQSPVERPVVAMSYELRMATLYYELRNEVPRSPIYRVRWRAITEVMDRARVGGIVVPTDGYQFVRWIEHRRPDMRCRTNIIKLPEGTRWPAYAFECQTSEAKDLQGR